MAKPSLVITGASRGIGQATAEKFLRQGWQVINLSRKPCPLPEVKSLCVDLSDANAIHACQADLQTALGNTDAPICLVHNAAQHHNGSILDIDVQALRQSFEINLVAPVQLTQLLHPLMPKKSSIIYIGSTLSEIAVPGTAPYVMAKHALLGLMRSTCQDLDDQGIHTCCICPGFTNTEMLREHVDFDDAVLAQITNQVTARRLVEPSEIAELIYFSATNPAINGAVLHANLGQKQA
jgi:3-oxoacyl-[acyl-carrier protein] reductase